MLLDTRRRGLARSLVGALATVAVVATGLAGQAQASPPTKPASAASKIKPELMVRLDGKDAKTATDFWVRFAARADLTAAGKITDWNERGTAVAAALRRTAAASQATVRAELTADHVDYQAFWATNAILIRGGNLELAKTLAGHTEVEGLYAPAKVELPKVSKGQTEPETNAVEWGIANINADDAWAKYGVKGQGITIGSIDSGVQYDHPALVKHYRGRKADGTFDHNYNWFDAAGTCGQAPCDADGHGTHTMGTMAGDDTAGNQIGVAPAVKWIAANGCCPDEAALVSSGQWMLEPTDLAGKHPDATKRPNIINSAWDTALSSPLMEDISLAWTASGIFGVFAQGDTGDQGCNTSGSPGNLASSYSTGAYDINNDIGRFSGRGSGQDNSIKPNISAPGVNVRSSLPGNSYGSETGTSMAAAHLSGTIALLWAASPALKGDVEATRALLNRTAVDKADGQCGGAAKNNNVYGQGRLDALALLAAAPTVDIGTLSGTVTVTGGDPLASASVRVSQNGEVYGELITTAAGTFSTVLPPGSYDVTAALFGHTTRTATVTITADQTTTQDFELAVAPQVTVDGTITDGSGHGWPLYAKVSIDGPGGVYDYTTPANGRFSIQVPGDTTYALKVEPLYPGYQTLSEPITLGRDDVTKDVAVPVRPEACTTAPGYKNGSDGVYETFDTDQPPAGWTVVDNIGNGQGWTFNDPGHRGNETGGVGGHAVIDSDRYGPGTSQDTSLVSPVVDLTAVTAPVIRFNQELIWLWTEKVDVDLSIDGGATWTTVLTQAQSRHAELKEIAIPQAAGKSAVQVRFHYYNATYAMWWEVDNVLIGSKTSCDPTGGGIVVGNVKDANTNNYVNGAVVTRDGHPNETASTVATPEDAGLENGFYWMYSSESGDRGFTTTAKNYVTTQESVAVDANRVSIGNYTLKAGQLSITPGDVSGTLKMPDGKVTRSFTVSNTGGSTVDLTFHEQNKGFVLQNADGSTITKQQVLNGPGAPLQRLSVPTPFGSKVEPGKAEDKPATAQLQEDPWIKIANYPETVMDNRVVNLDGKIYSIAGGDGNAATVNNYMYDPAALTWTAIAPLPAARNAMTVGVVNGKIIASGGWASDGPDGTTWSYDPAENHWTALAPNPAPRSAAGQAVVNGMLYAVGGCTTPACLPMSNDVVRYDPAGDKWETLPNYPKMVAFSSCGGIGGKLYCVGGHDGLTSQKSAYVFDPDTDAWTEIADAPKDAWASSYAVADGKLMVVGGSQGGSVTNAGFAYDPETSSWSNLPNANLPRFRGGAACGFYKVGGTPGGFLSTVDAELLPGMENCSDAPEDVSWMSLDKTEASLAPGQSTTVKVTLTANVDQPGAYTGLVTIGENTPYAAPAVDVKLSATPPNTWGRLQGTVTGVSSSGATSPLKGAILQVDSWAQSYTFITDKDGKYAHWLDRRNNPLTLIAAKDGYKPQTRTTKLVAGEAVTEDFALKSLR